MAIGMQGSASRPGTRGIAAPAVLASCWTTAGDTGPGSADQRSPFPLEERIRRAAEIGFTGFGLVHADLAEVRDGLGYPALRALLSRCGITVTEVEMLNDWFTTGREREESDIVRRDLLEGAAALGARHIKAGGHAGARHPVPWEVIVAEFARLCQQAAELGTRVALEPMPFTNFPDLAAGRRLVDEAAHPAGGLMIDLWHVARSRTSYAEVAATPLRYIFAVELDDAARHPEGTLLEDTLERRRLCGEGDLDVAGFIDAIAVTGFGGPWGVEILSREFRKLSLTEQVRRSYTTTRAALERALPVTNPASQAVP